MPSLTARSSAIAWKIEPPVPRPRRSLVRRIFTKSSSKEIAPKRPTVKTMARRVRDGRLLGLQQLSIELMARPARDAEPDDSRLFVDAALVDKSLLSVAFFVRSAGSPRPSPAAHPDLRRRRW